MFANDPLLKGALAILVVLMGTVFFWQPLKMTYSNVSITNDFVLQTTQGALDTKSLRGKVLVLLFGHANCSSACTDRLGKTVKAYSMLAGAERSQVRMILVSVDPERDTPARIGDYARGIHADLIGATGKPEEVKAITDAFAADTKKFPSPDGGEIIEPSALICVIDANGRFVAVLNVDQPPEKIAAALRARLPSVLPPKN